MTLLTVAERQLVLEAAFAGINHGLERQVRAMLPAIPLLVADKDACAICCAILLVGLNESPHASQFLAGVGAPDAEIVRRCFSL